MESPHSRQISVSGRLVIEGQLPDPRSAPSSENASVPPLPPRWTYRFARVCLKYLKSSLEIAGIAIALALVILTLLTLKQIKRQADLAQKQLTESIALFRTDERAWMGFSFMGGNLGLTIGQSFLVPTELLNSGKTPARQIMGDIVVRVIAKGETLDFDYTPGHGNTAYQINAGTIFPNGTIKESFEGLVHGRKEALILTKPILDDIIGLRAFIVVYGDITYIDIFGASHWTHYCRYVTAPALISEQCTKYNDTDHDEAPLPSR